MVEDQQHADNIDINNHMRIQVLQTQYLGIEMYVHYNLFKDIK